MPMKCPFRQDEHGEFLPCYGQACMAYYEYTPTPVTFGQNSTLTTNETPVPLCRKMLAAAPYYGGCA